VPHDGTGEARQVAIPVLSLVIPAYNSADYIAATVTRVVDAFRDLGITGEVIVVDDGSRDGTPDAVPSLPGVRTIALPRNSGKGAAVRAGMGVARGEVRGFTDADLPYGTEPLAYALACIRERGFHAAVGDRTLPGSSYASVGRLRTVVSDVASLAFRTLVTGGIYDTQCGFKLFRGDVAEALFKVTRIDRFAMDVELIYLLLKYRLDIKRIPVRLEDNASSSVHVLRDSARAFIDIARIRASWASSRYASAALTACLEGDLPAARNQHAPIRGRNPG
jgi:glycosyltransferase involved in cell wall biosynthesis